MAFQASSVAFHAPKKSKVGATIIARQDRIPVWALSRLFIGVIGLGFLFTLYDIGDINVSFVQTCVEIVSGCQAQTASHYLGLPVLLNLLGYVIGALFLSPLADRYGRRDLMVMTMVITGLGSLYTVFVGDYTNFIIARVITGIGVGADLALVNTYINEVAPNQGRGKYTTLIFMLGQVGAVLGIWLGLLLATPAEPFPFGLPFALASASFSEGWRVVYGVGASLAILGLMLRFNLPESPRWLISQGRITEAEFVVSNMEKLALTRIAELPPVSQELPVRIVARNTGYSEIFGNSLYLKRTVLLLVIWFTAYIAVYSLLAGFTVLLVTMGYPLPEAGLITAVGGLGGPCAVILAYFFSDKMERKFWLPIGGLLALGGGIAAALSNNLALTFLANFVASMGVYLWIPFTYTWSTENYPTRARASGFALVDGLGHVGGGLGFNFIAPIAFKLGPLPTFILIGCFLLAAAGLAQFGPATRNKRLDEVSP
jgi:putative MFS transporter